MPLVSTTAAGFCARNLIAGTAIFNPRGAMGAEGSGRADPARRATRESGDAVWMAICAAVGYKTLDGSLNKWVPTAIWLANGAQFFLAPQSAIDLYEMKGTNRLCQAMTGLMGGQMLCVGTYLAALLMDKSQSEAFAYAMAVNGLAAAKFALQDADDLKSPKAGPLAWTALSAGLAYKALN